MSQCAACGQPAPAPIYAIDGKPICGACWWGPRSWTHLAEAARARKEDLITTGPAQDPVIVTVGSVRAQLESEAVEHLRKVLASVRGLINNPATREAASWLNVTFGEGTEGGTPGFMLSPQARKQATSGG